MTNTETVELLEAELRLAYVVLFSTYRAEAEMAISKWFESYRESLLRLVKDEAMHQFKRSGRVDVDELMRFLAGLAAKLAGE